MSFKERKICFHPWKIPKGKSREVKNLMDKNVTGKKNLSNLKWYHLESLMFASSSRAHINFITWPPPLAY